MARRLTVRYTDGDAIPEALLREAWELRLTMLVLTRTREEDWSSFRGNVVGPEKRLFTFHDTAGRVQGFFTVMFLPVDAVGKRGLLLYSKYFYFSIEYRGHPMTMIAPWRLLPTSLRRYGLRSLHFCTTAFPQSYISLFRASGRAYALSEEDVPAFQRAALEVFAKKVGGECFDPETGTISGGNVAESPSLPRSAEGKALYARYERLNPKWREGVSLPILFSVDARLVRTNLARVVRRWRR